MRPLEGLRILDLSRVLAGPFAARMLCDLGADVVKVEPPGGDVTRGFGRRLGNQTGYFAQQNAGKRGVCIDLGQPGGSDLIRQLAAQADVVLENFRPDVLARYGLDWAALSADHPSLVMVSISGFGQDGPESHRAAYAGIIQSESGWLARQAIHAGAAPVDSQLSVADTTSGLHSLVGMLVALRVRDQTGIGQHVDLAMVDCLAVVDDYLYWALDGVEDAPPGGGEVWDAIDGSVMVQGDFRWVWKSANEILGVADPTPPGATIPEKVRLRRHAWQEYLLAFPTRASMLSELDRANLAWASVRTPTEALASPTMAHRGTIIDIDNRSGGTRRIIQSPYHFSHSEAGVRGSAPLLGEHNAEVLGEWLGLNAEAVADLETTGVLVKEGI